MANFNSTLQAQFTVNASHELLTGNWALEQWGNNHQLEVARLLLFKAFGCSEGRTLTLAELSQINTPDNIPLMMLSVGWSALLHVGTDYNYAMDPWHLRDEYRDIDIKSQSDRDIYHRIEEIYEASKRVDKKHQGMTAEEGKAWAIQWKKQQATIVKNEIEHRLGLNTTSHFNGAVTQEAQRIGQKVLEYVNNGVANPFALDEIRTMFEAAGSAGSFEMSDMRALLEEMSGSIPDPFVFDQFKNVLLETITPLILRNNKCEPHDSETH
jgi:hypothetical protein